MEPQLLGRQIYPPTLRKTLMRKVVAKLSVDTFKLISAHVDEDVVLRRDIVITILDAMDKEESDNSMIRELKSPLLSSKASDPFGTDFEPGAFQDAIEQTAKKSPQGAALVLAAAIIHAGDHLSASHR
jgi:hypothetical protein